ARMRELISANIGEASNKRTAPMVAEVAPDRGEANAAPQGFGLASAKSVSVNLAARPEPAPQPKTAAPNAGSTDPIRPVMVRTVQVKPSVRTASAAPVPAAEAPARSEAAPTAPV